MLTVRSGDGGRMAFGLGFGGDSMEEDELEEGEAFSGLDDATFIDPDAPSYIDEKIQNVLGHFQKDFEGGVFSAENLGSKFGGYGSFLPTYQRSTQAGKSPNATSHNGLISPGTGSHQFEGSHRNNLIPTVIAPMTTTSNGPAVPSLGGKPEQIVDTNAFIVGGSLSEYDSVDPFPESDQKSLKFRIKVGPESMSAIYSGLGLDISSSPSEDSPYGSEGHSTDINGTFNVSPMTIIQIMTSFPIPEEFLLSPLPDGLLCLSESNIRSFNNLKINVIDMCNSGGMKNLVRKKRNPSEKNGVALSMKDLACKNDTTSNKMRETGIGTLAEHEIISQPLNIPSVSSLTTVYEKDEAMLFNESTMDTKDLGVSFEQSKVSARDLVHPADLKTRNKPMLKEIVKNTGNNYSEHENMHSNERLNIRESFQEKVLGEKGNRDCKGFSDVPKDNIVDAERNCVAGKGDFVDHSVRKYRKISNSDVSEKLSSQGTPFCDVGGEIMLQGKVQTNKNEEKIRIPTGGPLPSDSTKKKHKAHMSVALKEQMETYSATADVPSNTHKKHKSYDTQNSDLCKDANWNLGDVKVDAVDHKHTMAHDNDRLIDSEERNVKELVKATEKLKERCVGNMLDNLPSLEEKCYVPQMAASNPNMPHLGAFGAPHAAVVIKENWVRCDNCYKWRLLPYDADPDYENKQFLCSMQNWLAPGLNSCSASEDETTKALHALYHAPVSNNDANLNGLRYDAATDMKLANIDHSSGDNTIGVNVLGKNKHGLKDTSITSNNPPLIQCHKSSTSRCLNDTYHHSEEANSSSKLGMEFTSKSIDLSLDKGEYKQKDKRKDPGLKLHADHIVEHSAKHSNSDNERALGQDDMRTSKKRKIVGLVHCSDDYRSDHEESGREISYGLLHKANKKISNEPICLKDVKDDLRNDAYAFDEKIKGEVSNVEDRDHHNASSIGKSDKIGFAAKKKKSWEWQESQGNKETLVSSQTYAGEKIEIKEEFSENELKMEKKSKLSMSDAQESSSSKIYGNIVKTMATELLLSPAVKKHVSSVMDDSRMIINKEEQFEQYRESTSAMQLFCGMESCRKDSLYARPSAAETSSSSKLSGSHRSRLQEVKGSPIDSVSSSPIRTYNKERIHSSRHNAGGQDAVADAVFSVASIAKKCPDGQGKNAIVRSGKTNEMESFPLKSPEKLNVVRSHDVNSSGGTNEYAENNAKNYDKTVYNCVDRSRNDKICHQKRGEANTDHLANGTSRRNSNKNSSHVKEKNSPGRSCARGRHQVHYSEQRELNSSNIKRAHENRVDSSSHDRRSKDSISGKFNKEKKVEDYLHRKELVVKAAIGASMEAQLDCGTKEILGGHESCILEKSAKDIKSRDSASAFCGKSGKQDKLSQISHEDGKYRPSRPEMASGKGKHHIISSSKDKAETPSQGPQRMRTPHHVGKTKSFTAGSSNGDVSKIKSKKPDELNGLGLTHCSLRQATPDDHDARSLDKDSHHFSIALKEARRLKHTATRLMEHGQILESLGLYYQSCLKYLQIAFQMENVDDGKNGESSQSVTIYSDTAKLCDYCAREYEKNKQMAAAALSYKCMEVAYMKVLYLKRSSASKDKHELQTTLQMLLPGGSPPSASDVENLNHQVALDKVVQTKGAGSPQIPGNYSLSARNRPIVTRLLDYTNGTFIAFEATRKMHTAFNAARACSDKDNADRLSKVKMALDSSFHDVESVVQLLRLAMESISR